MRRRGKHTTARGGSSSASSPRRRGRPPLERDTTVKASVVLFTRHVSYLDRLSLDIRDASGRIVTRSDALRGIVEGVATSGVDLTAAASEAEIADVIRSRPGRRSGSS